MQYYNYNHNTYLANDSQLLCYQPKKSDMPNTSLVTVDLVCRGTPSPLLLNCHISAHAEMIKPRNLTRSTTKYNDSPLGEKIFRLRITVTNKTLYILGTTELLTAIQCFSIRMPQFHIFTKGSSKDNTSLLYCPFRYSSKKPPEVLVRNTSAFFCCTTKLSGNVSSIFGFCKGHTFRIIRNQCTYPYQHEDSGILPHPLSSQCSAWGKRYSMPNNHNIDFCLLYLPFLISI